MQRFVYQQKKQAPRLLLTFLIICLILLLFFAGIGLISRRTGEEEIETLNTQLWQCIVQCYCMEGAYPESLAYLETNYHLTYDKERFLIDYQPLGKNIIPDVTVILRQEEP